MGKKQSRRSISLSVSGRTYARVEAFVRAQPPGDDQPNGRHAAHLSVSHYVETLIARDLDARGIPLVYDIPQRTPRPKPQPQPSADDPVASGIFTF